MIINEAIEVLKTEAQSILDLTGYIDESFEKMVELILSSQGRVIVSGIGKSGLIGRKIVATLSSTGTRALFLHPVEAVHGDLGNVTGQDTFIAISNSGETEELNQLLPTIRELGCSIVAFTGIPESSMASLSDIVIHTGVKKEACPLGLAPTSSTTAQLAMGDALAVVLINKKKFKKDDFQKSHPGGVLGQRLSLRVRRIMFTADQSPAVPLGTGMSDAIKEVEKYKMGAVFILDPEGCLQGIVTDGDIRHMVAEVNTDFSNMAVESAMTRNPLTIFADSYLYEALNLMEKNQITVLPVVDHENRFQGMLHLHDILGKGEFKFNGGAK
ncbi:MAG: KpsF/GutQ family sugar-phosphate isomerase [Desulfobacteraceae bacterium]